MRVFYDFSIGEGPSAAALGCFDGLHTGHRAVIEATAQRGLISTVVTFQSDIFRGLGATKPGGELMTQTQKLRLLERMGVRQVYFLRFSDVMDYSPTEFVNRILIDVCRVRRVCCGFNFTFGRGGRGTSETLRALCGSRGIETQILPPVLLNSEPVSSTRIRALVAQGHMREAAELLGRPFGFDFEVVHGRKLGRAMGTPTLNQVFPCDFALPRFGVYASVVTINRRRYIGVTNVGVKPTVGADSPLAETWLPEYEGRDLYGRSLQTDLIEFVRPEEHFSSMEELQKNIFQDRDAVQRILKGRSRAGTH